MARSIHNPWFGVAGIEARPAAPDRARVLPAVLTGVAVVVTVLLVGSIGWSIELLPCVLFVAMASIAVDRDLEHHRLPNPVTLGGFMAVVAGWVVVCAVRADGGALVGSLLGAALFAVMLVVPHLIRPSALGFGDVKLALPLGAVLGPFGLLLVPVACLVAQVVQVVAAAALRQRRLPFAPSLALATVACLLLAMNGARP